MTDDDNWPTEHLHQLAVRLIALERDAELAERQGDILRARNLWTRRNLVQWQRSEFLREQWAVRARERERQSSCRPSSPDAA